VTSFSYDIPDDLGLDPTSLPREETSFFTTMPLLRFGPYSFAEGGHILFHDLANDLHFIFYSFGVRSTVLSSSWAGAPPSVSLSSFARTSLLSFAVAVPF